MPVDSFKWLPRSIAAFYQAIEVPEPESIPWTPLAKPLAQCRIALITSTGLYLKDEQPPFDVERERREPFWGDPTYRVIPADVRQEQVAATHLHLNLEDVHQDMNVALPIQRLHELVEAGEVGSMAAEHYSFMGYQAPDAPEWRQRYGPEVAQRMIEQQVDAALLAPA
jgi:D-proline reductase (dithiol) PrdB